MGDERLPRIAFQCTETGKRNPLEYSDTDLRCYKLIDDDESERSKGNILFLKSLIVEELFLSNNILHNSFYKIYTSQLRKSLM